MAIARKGPGERPPLRVVGARGEPQLPCNLQAERTVLGAVLIDPTQFSLACGALQPSDFYTSEHQTIFTAMQTLALADIPIELGTLVERLRAEGLLAAAGGQAGISELVNDVVSTATTPHYARIVLEIGCEREAIQIAAEVVSSAYKAQGDVLGVLAYAQNRLSAIADRRLLAEHDAESEFTASVLRTMEIAPARWVVPGLLPVGLTLLAAKQKIGKSWLALALCLAVATLDGHAFGSIAVERGDVLYLALEDTAGRLKDRIHLLTQTDHAWAWPQELTLWTKCPRLDAGGLRKIEGWLKEHSQARLVVVDVLAKVRPARVKNGDIYSEDYDVMTPLKALSEAYNVALLVVHHTRKSSADDVFDEISGSMGLAGACDAAMVMQRARGEHTAVLHMTGRDIGEQSLALSQSEQTHMWRILGDAQEVTRSQERTDILDLLRMDKQPMRAKDIAGELGSNPFATKKLLADMASDGQIVRVDRGLYTLPTIPPTSPSPTPSSSSSSYHPYRDDDHSDDE